MRNKKYAVILLAVILLFSFTACGKTDNQIDAYSWNCATVQSSETNGAIIAYDPNVAPAGDRYANAAEIEISLSAKNGKLTIQDKTNSKTYEGRYSVTDNRSQSTIYKITVDVKEGIAVLSDTEYADGTSVATLILSVDDYALTFYGAPCDSE